MPHTRSFHACQTPLLSPVGNPPVFTETDFSPILAAGSQVQVGVEFEANTRLQDTTFSFGYHLTLPQANMVFRGEGRWGDIGRRSGHGPPTPCFCDALLQPREPPRPQAWWTVTGVWVLCWRRRCLPCLSPSPSEPSLTIGATDPTVASVSLWAEGVPEPPAAAAAESGAPGPETRPLSRAHLAGRPPGPGSRVGDRTAPSSELELPWGS